MNIYRMFDVQELNYLITEGFISRRTHPHLDLVILHYTAKTTLERFWNPITMRCRGLIVDSPGEIVGNCLVKFFSEDLEGRYLSVCTFNDELILAYQGSFEGEEIAAASKIIGSYPKHLLAALLNDSTAFFKPVLENKKLEGVSLIGTLANFELAGGQQLWKPANELSWPIVQL